MTTPSDPTLDRDAPTCPCHGWPMTRRWNAGFACLWCGNAVAPDGTWGRWRWDPETPSDLVECSERPGTAGNRPGHGPQPEEEVGA